MTEPYKRPHFGATKNVYVPRSKQAVWDHAQAKAARMNVSLSAVVVWLLERWAKQPDGEGKP